MQHADGAQPRIRSLVTRSFPLLGNDLGTVGSVDYGYNLWFISTNYIAAILNVFFMVELFE